MKGVNNKQNEHIKYSVSEGVIVMENRKKQKRGWIGRCVHVRGVSVGGCYYKEGVSHCD